MNISLRYKSSYINIPTMNKLMECNAPKEPQSISAAYRPHWTMDGRGDVLSSCGAGVGLVDVSPGQTIVLVWRIVGFGVWRGLWRGATLLAVSRDKSVVHLGCSRFRRPSDLTRLAEIPDSERVLRFLERGFIEMTWGVSNTCLSAGVVKSDVEMRMSRRRFSSTAERTPDHLKRISGLMRKTSSKASEFQVAFSLCRASLAALRLVRKMSGVHSDRIDGLPWSPKSSRGWLQTKSTSKMLGDWPYLTDLSIFNISFSARTSRGYLSISGPLQLFGSVSQSVGSSLAEKEGSLLRQVADNGWFLIL